MQDEVYIFLYSQHIRDSKGPDITQSKHSQQRSWITKAYVKGENKSISYRPSAKL